MTRDELQENLEKTKSSLAAAEQREAQQRKLVEKLDIELAETKKKCKEMTDLYHDSLSKRNELKRLNDERLVSLVADDKLIRSLRDRISMLEDSLLGKGS